MLYIFYTNTNMNMNTTTDPDETTNIWQLRDNLVIPSSMNLPKEMAQNEFPTTDQCFDFLYQKVVKLQNEHNAYIERLNKLEERIAILTKECIDENNKTNPT